MNYPTVRTALRDTSISRLFIYSFIFMPTKLWLWISDLLTDWLTDWLFTFISSCYDCELPHDCLFISIYFRVNKFIPFSIFVQIQVLYYIYIYLSVHTCIKFSTYCLYSFPSINTVISGTFIATSAETSNLFIHHYINPIIAETLHS